MLLLRIYFASAFILFASSYTTASPHHIQDIPFEEANNNYVIRDAATESGFGAADVTTEGVLSAMWHKITNFFAADNSGSPGAEGQRAPEKKQRAFGRRAVRMVVPPETRKGNLHHDVRRMLKEPANKDEGGVLAPPPSSSEVNRSARGMRYAKIIQDYDDAYQVRGNPMYGNAREDEGKPFVEEFDEGQRGIDRKKRFKDVPSDVWITEKISEGSDPVENIDKENYIEEIMENPFQFHERTFRPILVEDELTAGTLPQETELLPVQIIEY